MALLTAFMPPQQHGPGGGNYRVTMAVSLLTSAAVTCKLSVDNIICGNWYQRREKKEIRWNLKLCTAGKKSFTSDIPAARSDDDSPIEENRKLLKAGSGI